MGYTKKWKFLLGPESLIVCTRAQRYYIILYMMILNLSESLAKQHVMAKLNMAYLSSLKNRAKLLLSSLPVSPSQVLRAPGTSSFSGHVVQSLSNPTSFLRPVLPMAPTKENNARDERSVFRPNPATFLRDFTLYMYDKNQFNKGN